MIVNAPDLEAIGVLKTEDESVLVIHPDTPEAFRLTAQLLQVIGWRHSKVLE